MTQMGRYGRRRPRPGLHRDAIVIAAIELVEREGLAALTMRAVAGELGVGPMSLYRHVSDRDDLLVEMLELLAGGMPRQVAGDTPAARLRARLLAAHDYLAAHLWVVQVLIEGQLVARAAVPFAEVCLRDFCVAGLGTTDAARAYLACWQLLVGELLEGHPRATENSQRVGVAASFEEADVPHLVVTRDWYEGYRADATARDAAFAWSLDRLLAGILDTVSVDH